MFDRIKAKEKSKTLLRTRSIADAIGYGVILVAKFAIVFLLLPFVIASLLGFIASFVYSSVSLIRWASAAFAILTISAVITIILCLVIGVVMAAINLLFHAGMIRSSLRYNRGDQNVRVIDTILAGDRLGRYISITLWQILFLFLWNLPSAFVIVLSIVFMVIGLISFNTVAAAFAVILMIAATVWSIYITLNKYCQYYFSYYVAEDKREISALDCVRESGSMMVDHKWELFVTMLSFLGWDVISCLPAGSVFVTPYKYLTYASIYEQLTGTFKPVSRGQMLWMNNKPSADKPISESNEPGQKERVIEMISGEFAGSQFNLNAGEEIAIGRDPRRANIVSTNNAISGLHCRIRFDERTGKYIVIDQSTNGTYVNNERLAPEKGVYVNRGSIVKLADGAMLIRLS